MHCGCLAGTHEDQQLHTELPQLQAGSRAGEGANKGVSHKLTPSENPYLIIQRKMLCQYKDHIQKISWRVNTLKAEGSFFNYLPPVLVFLHIFPSADFAVSWPDQTVTCFSFWWHSVWTYSPAFSWMLKFAKGTHKKVVINSSRI